MAHHQQAMDEAQDLKKALRGVNEMLEAVNEQMETFCRLARGCREEAEQLEAIDINLEAEIEELERFASAAKAAREEREAIEEENAALATGEAHA
jgi:hypothetical protein